MVYHCSHFWPPRPPTCLVAMSKTEITCSFSVMDGGCSGDGGCDLNRNGEPSKLELHAFDCEAGYRPPEQSQNLWWKSRETINLGYPYSLWRTQIWSNKLMFFSKNTTGKNWVYQPPGHCSAVSGWWWVRCHHFRLSSVQVDTGGLDSSKVGPNVFQWGCWCLLCCLPHCCRWFHPALSITTGANWKSDHCNTSKGLHHVRFMV